MSVGKRVNLQFQTARQAAENRNRFVKLDTSPRLPMCGVFLRNDQVGGFGIGPADISGQTFSITNAGVGGFGVSTDVNNSIPAWVGTRIIRFSEFSNNGAANIRAGIVAPDASKGLFFSFNSDGTRHLRYEAPVGNILDDTSIGAASSFAIGVEMPSGNCKFYIDGSPINTGVAPYLGAFSGQASFVLLGLIESAGAGTASMTFDTSGSMYPEEYPAGVQDICGNAVPEWTPDSELSGVINSFWADPLASTLFQDDALLVPADATAEPVGGVLNQSTIGSATLNQIVIGNRLKVAADGRIERDGTTTSQALDLNATIDLTNGFCVAVDAEGLISFPIFGEAPEFYALRGSSGSLAIRVGGFTSRTINSVFTTDRKRIVITGDGVDYTVFVDGVSFGTFATDVAKTVFSSIALGLANAATSGIAAKYGRLLFAEKDMRTVIGNLDAWLAGV